MNVVGNEYVVASSLITLHGENIEEYYKEDIVKNIEFESIVSSTKKYFFHQRMVDFVNKLELSDQKYQTDGNITDGNNNRRFLFPVKNLVSFGTYHR